MKNIIILLFSLLLGSAQAQSGLQISPELNITQPQATFASQNLAAETGFGAGLHIDKLWKNIGLGIYAAYDINNVGYQTNFPQSLNNANFSARQYVDVDDLRWKSLQAAIGPILNLNLSGKLQLQLFTKGGIAKIKYPRYRYFLDVSSPINQEINLFETVNNPEGQSNFNLMLTSGLRMQFMISQSFGIHIGAKYTHIKDVVHSYTTIKNDYDPNIEPAALYETIVTSPQVTVLEECNINTITGTVGITFRFGGGDKPPKPDKIPDQEPEVPFTEDYDCEQIVYQNPGFNDVVILNKSPKVTFEWKDKNSENAKEGMQYQLKLFTKTVDGYQEVHSEVVEKNDPSINISSIASFPDYALFWQIVPTISIGETTYCPYVNKKMKVLVFKNKKEAEEHLPECKQ